MVTGQHGNRLVTVSAAGRLIPSPPALVLSRNTKISDLQNDNVLSECKLVARKKYMSILSYIMYNFIPCKL